MCGFGLLLEDLLRDQDGGYCPWPPSVERQVGNDLGELGLRDAVRPGPVQVAWKLLGISVGNECRNGDQAAVSLRQLCTCSNITE